MQKGLKKKLSFILITFFVFSYQISNFNLTKEDYKTVAAAENKVLLLGGQSIGVNIDVEGIQILRISPFKGEDGIKHCPAKEAGIKEGDIILSVNGKKVNSAADFINMVDNICPETLQLVCKRNKEEFTVNVVPVKAAEDGEYRLGLWAYDGTTGIGTLTFVDPSNNVFGALGHGVAEDEADDLIKPENGNIYYSEISNITRGEKYCTGELQGYFISSKIGSIEKNTELGIFGKFNDNIFNATQIEVAKNEEIKNGPATIYCCIDGNNVQSFAIEIEEININSKNNKSMIIKVTDEKLLKITGGIIQGMSGSPIVQNGKLIGAVTHVFVNDPTRGYGIFIENMLSVSEKI